MNHLGLILPVSELTICREAAPTHQQTATPSQKPTSTSNPTVSQAVCTQKQSYSPSAGASRPFSEQHPGGQKSMYPHCISYHLIALISLRHHSARKSSLHRLRPLESGNERKKHSKPDLPPLKPLTSLRRSDFEPSLRVVALKRYRIRGRRVTPTRPALTRSGIGFELGSGLRNTSNKTARSEKILKGESFRRSRQKEIGSKSLKPKNLSDQCTAWNICVIFLRGRGPPRLLLIGRDRNQHCKHLAINCRGKSKAPNTKMQYIKIN